MNSENKPTETTSREEMEKLLVNEKRSFYDGRVGRLLVMAIIVVSSLNLIKGLFRILFGDESSINFVNIFLGFILPLGTIALMVFNRRSNRSFYRRFNLSVAKHNLNVMENYRESLKEERLQFSRAPSTASGLSRLDQLEAEIRETELAVQSCSERVAYHRSLQTEKREGFAAPYLDKEK